MATEAQEALQDLKIPVPVHRAQNLSADLATQAEFIFCMTQSQRETALNMFPEAASKILCLKPGLDLEDPHMNGKEGFAQLAKLLQDIMPSVVDHLLSPIEIHRSGRTQAIQ